MLDQQIISLKAVKEAFLSGIAAFVELYNIQNNKNIISQGLGNIFLSISHRHKIEITSIMNSELEGAMRWKDVIESSNEDELIKNLKIFADKLSNIEKTATFDYSKCYLTSYYSFITLHIYHCAIIDNTFKTNIDKDIYNTIAENILIKYLTPNTTGKKDLTPLYEKVKNALEAIPDTKDAKVADKRTHLHNKNIIKLAKGNQLSLDSASETDKLWAYICKSNINGAREFLAEKDIEKYLELANDINKYGQQEADQYQISEDRRLINDIEKIKFAKIKITISFISALLYGLSKYTETYIRKTSQKGDAKIISDEIRGSSKYYASGVMRSDLTTIYSWDKKSTSGLFFPSSTIFGICTNLAMKIIQTMTQSKAYGYTDRHGITGQIRACLLRNYLSLLITRIENYFNYSYMLLTSNNSLYEPDLARLYLNYIDKMIDSFKNNYDMARRRLPDTKNDYGSMRYKLDMCADIYKFDDIMKQLKENKTAKEKLNNIRTIFSDNKSFEKVEIWVNPIMMHNWRTSPKSISDYIGA